MMGFLRMRWTIVLGETTDVAGPCFLFKGCKFNMPRLASFSSILKVVLSLPLLSSLVQGFC